MYRKYKLLVILENHETDWKIASGISHFQSKTTRRIRLIMDHHEQTKQIIKQWKPDILITYGERGRQLNSKLPTVYIAGERAGTPRFNVTLDNEAIGNAAAEYFLEKGFRNFAYITGKRSMPFSIPRLKGFQQTLADHGMKSLVFDNLCLSGLNPIQTTDQNMKRLEQWLKKAPKPLSVFAHNDTHGLHILEACEQAKLHVPEDIAILGVSNQSILCTFSFPQLSSMEIPYYEIGKTAARLAEEALFQKNKKPETIVFPPGKIITRKSSDIIASASPELKAAIRYISQNVGVPLQPKDVVAQAFTSRSKLQRIFRQEINRSILEEIHRQKLERSKELLEETSLPVYEIGEKCGMPSTPQFFRFFTQKTGTSPLKYRQACLKKNSENKVL